MADEIAPQGVTACGPSRSATASARCRSETSHWWPQSRRDHRRAAFETCALLVDTVKARLPVWKHQFFGDGSDGVGRLRLTAR